MRKAGLAGRAFLLALPHGEVGCSLAEFLPRPAGAASVRKLRNCPPTSAQPELSPVPPPARLLLPRAPLMALDLLGHQETLCHALSPEPTPRLPPGLSVCDRGGALAFLPGAGASMVQPTTAVSQ